VPPVKPTGTGYVIGAMTPSAGTCRLIRPLSLYTFGGGPVGLRGSSWVASLTPAADNAIEKSVNPVMAGDPVAARRFREWWDNQCDLSLNQSTGKLVG
jgi:hypothetical protein